MAKKQGVSKTKAVLDYWKAHPKAKAKEIAEALTKAGTPITPAYDYIIKNKSKTKRLERKAAQAGAGIPESQAATAQRPAAATPKAPEKRTEPAGTITLQHIKAVAQTVKAMGGFDRLNELVAVIREVGGLRRFKELLEAIAVTEAGKLPF